MPTATNLRKPRTPNAPPRPANFRRIVSHNDATPKSLTPGPDDKPVPPAQAFVPPSPQLSKQQKAQEWAQDHSEYLSLCRELDTLTQRLNALERKGHCR